MHISRAVQEGSRSPPLVARVPHDAEIVRIGLVLLEVARLLELGLAVGLVARVPHDAEAVSKQCSSDR